MASRVAYSRDEILDAAVRATHDHWRSATVAHVTATLGAPSGSIYHRFPSRDSLFASAWIRSVRRFHSAFATVVDTDDPVEAIAATGLLVPRFCRQHPYEARMLTAFRYAELAADPPGGTQSDLEGLNDPVVEHITLLTRRRYGRVTERGLALVALACRDTPYGIVRPLIGAPIPNWLDEPIAAASRAIALLDDTADPPPEVTPR